jgi:hypothetical protein
MLKEIRCEKFMDDGRPRGPITFHMGLNSVNGDKESSNSIGKSTFLMIIDFCFGGDDYVDKESDTIDHLGEHEIQFEFDFLDGPHFFSRRTDDKETVNICDSSYRPTLKISNAAFKDFLSKEYGVDSRNLTFRSVVSRFFRIYNRNTHNELRPLNATVREDDRSGIESMLKLYGLYQNIQSQLEIADKANFKKISYANAGDYGLAAIARDQDEFESNKKEIEEIQGEIADIEKDLDTGTDDPDFIKGGIKSDLQDERKSLRYQKRILQGRMNDIDFDKNYDPQALAKNIETLKKFFPNETFQEIQDIDSFHKEVKAILKRNFEEDNGETISMIQAIDQRLDDIDKQLLELKQTKPVPRDVVDRHSDLKARLKYLLASNQHYLEKKEVDTLAKKASEDLDAVVIKESSIMENQINSEMSRLNEQFSEKKNAPVLEINGLKSYAFYTPSDTGTGTRMKGVALFDLAVLSQTKVPAIAHDSVIFANMSKPTIEDLIKLYLSQTEKQIFIAFDDPKKTPTISNILEAKNVCVLSLSEEPHALFGRQWNKDGHRR